MITFSREGPDYILTAQASLPLSLGQVFPFFADARNLETLTPSILKFRITTPLPIMMGQGTRIDYRIVLSGVPMRWSSEITEWNPPYRFVDEQRRGPYSKWVHEHTFQEVNGQTIVCDHVRYNMLFAAVVHPLIVRPKLEQIFCYRDSMMRKLFVETS